MVFQILIVKNIYLLQMIWFPTWIQLAKTFEGQKDLLALFRVLGNVVMTLPERRRHAHVQGLLNISSASLNSPVQISWQSEVYKPVEKCLTVADQTVILFDEFLGRKIVNI